MNKSISAPYFSYLVTPEGVEIFGLGLKEAKGVLEGTK